MARDLLGRIGLWDSGLRHDGVRKHAPELAELGFRSFWLRGFDGRGLLDDAAALLRLVPTAAVALGVLPIGGHDPVKVTARVRELDALHGPRLVLGLGVGGGRFPGAAGPVDGLNRYLDRLDAAPDPVPAGRRVIGALGPRMSELAARRTAGVHPYLVTPEFIADRRARLGPDALLAPAQPVVLDTDPDRARRAARDAVAGLVSLPFYQANLRRLGFTDADLVPGGSDRLIDAVVAHGTADDVRERVLAHHQAGADHVAVQVIGGPELPRDRWRDLAAALLEG